MNHRICIPVVGTEITLARQWDLQLFNAPENQALMSALGDRRDVVPEAEQTARVVSLPTSMTLRVDQVALSDEPGERSRVAFSLVGKRGRFDPHAGYIADGTRERLPDPVPFWVPLESVNTMLVALCEPETLPM